jgi:large subunit ribosomal protein L32
LKKRPFYDRVRLLVLNFSDDMGVPKSRHTKSQRNRRRSNIFLKRPNFVSCSKCGKQILPHIVCWNCGYYKGREVINVLEKLEKKERKQREKEIKVQEKTEEKKEKPLTVQELSKK